MKAIIQNLIDAVSKRPTLTDSLQNHAKYDEQVLVPAIEMASKLADCIFTKEDLAGMMEAFVQALEEIKSELKTMEHIYGIMESQRGNPMVHFISNADSPEEFKMHMEDRKRTLLDRKKDMDRKYANISRMVELTEMESLTR